MQTFKHYFGSLDREAWDRMLACVDAAAEHLRTSPQLDRRVVSSLWAICHFTRSWGLAPDGMLRRNGLIGDPDRETLAGWVADLTERITFLLDGQED